MKQEIKERVERIRKGEVPEGYVINKFGIYPEDWVKMPFYQIFDFEGGFTASRNDLGDEGIAYLHYGDIHKSNKNFIDVKKELSGIPKINLDINNVPKKNLLKDGYVVFADASEDYEGIGKSVTIFNPDEIPFINGLHTIVGVPKNGTLNKNYSRFFLLEQSIRKQRMFYAQGISVLGISKVYLNKIIVQLPSDPEQQKISEILSTWDKAIELKEKLIEEKKEFKKGLMQKLLTGKIRFSEFNDEWEEIPLSNIVNRITSKNNENNQTVITISAKEGFVNQDEYFNKLVASKDLSGYFLIKKGDFAYNKSYSNGYPVGAIKRLDSFENAVVTTLYICFRIKDGEVSSNFLKYYFDSGLLNRQIKRIANEGGRAHGLLNVTPNDFFNIKVNLPEYEEQKKISKTLLANGQDIQLSEKELFELKEQKKGLMQLLLTGIVRVNS